jgi:transposase-like protein
MAAKRKKYDINDISRAVSEVQEGSSVRSVAKKYAIPSSTLHDHCV